MNAQIQSILNIRFEIKYSCENEMNLYEFPILDILWRPPIVVYS